MSLMERVRSAQGTADEQPSEETDRAVSLLREAVRKRIPGEELAALAADNPFKAQNEVRSICTELFESSDSSGRPIVEPHQRKDVVDRLLDALFGLGPLEVLLADESVTEVMVNGTESLYCERRGRLESCDFSFENEEEVRSLIDRIIGPLGRRIDESSPMVDARLPEGHRVNAIVPPLSLSGPLLTIRKFTERVITLEDMVALGSMDEAMVSFLDWAVRARLNIAVAGGTGTGKTTLLNALSCRIPFEERVVTIEDSAELRFLEHPHVVRLEARPMNAEGSGEVTIRDLVTNSLRMRPDRIVVGECRGGEALDMLQAMNTGHDGSLTTLHANSPADVILRLTTMVRYTAELPVDVIEKQIASALDLVVQINRSASGVRYLSSVVELSYDHRGSEIETNVLYEREMEGDAGTWLTTPGWMDDLSRRNLATKEEVSSWKRAAFSPA